MAGALYANVSERRSEIGTLMALGATPGLVLRLIVGKALVLGLAGGLAGAVLGSAPGVWLGPSTGERGGTAAAVAGSGRDRHRPGGDPAGESVPAWRAARLDPCVCFQEV